MTIPDGWQCVKLGELGVFSKGTGITKAELKEQGLPCIRYGEIYTRHDFKVKQFYSFIDNKTAQNSKKLNYNDLLFAGSGETLAEIGKAISYQMNDIAYAGGDIIILNIPLAHRADYIAYYINSIGRKYLNKLGAGNSVVHIYAKDLKGIPILLPPLHTQRAIADMLDVWDRAIEKTDALVKAKEKKFGWLVTKCINKSNYKKKQLSDFIDEVSIRNKDNKTERVLSVTNHRGFVLPQEHFERRIASADLSNYKIVLNGEYAYNPSRINVGSIARLEQWDIGVLSPMYTAFKINHTKTNSDYFFIGYFQAKHDNVSKIHLKEA
jgi:type I restriction enzyme, S subunit